VKISSGVAKIVASKQACQSVGRVVGSTTDVGGQTAFASTNLASTGQASKAGTSEQDLLGLVLP
jgi:hypothetical protein